MTTPVQMTPAQISAALANHRCGELSMTAGSALAALLASDPVAARLAVEEVGFDRDVALAARGVVLPELVARLRRVQALTRTSLRHQVVTAVHQRGAMLRGAGAPESYSARAGRVLSTRWQRPAMLAAAAVLVLVVGAGVTWRLSSTSAFASTPPSTLALLASPQALMAVGNEWVVGEQSVTMQRADGLRATLSPGSRIAAQPAPTMPNEAALALRYGTVAVTAPHQAAGSMLRFSTPHVEVTVVGTRFTMAVGSGTTVQVSEGAVRVRDRATGAEVTVPAGESVMVGVLAEWNFATGTGDVTLVDGTLVAPTGMVPGHILGVARSGGSNTVNVVLPEVPACAWDQIGAVELELDAEGDLFALLTGTEPSPRLVGVLKHRQPLTAGWRTMRLPTELFIGEVNSQARVSKCTFAISGSKPFRLARIALVPKANPQK